MKVVHIVEAWKGGVATYVEALIKDQVSRGYRVFLLADGAQLDADSRSLGVEVLEYKSSRNPLRFLSIALELFKTARQLDPDIVHCHSTFPGVYVRLLKYPCKIIYTPHAWSFFKGDVNVLLRWIFKGVELLLARRCSKITCMSLEEVKAASQIGIESSKIKLIYTGIPDHPKVVALNPDVKLGKQAALKVGFFGRFDYQKGFDLVVDAVEKLHNNIEVHLFGGAVRGKKDTLNSRFFVHGWIEHQMIHQYMTEMDVILVPSRWEGFALAPLEAMRAARPVVVSNLSSLPEVVINGFNGIVLRDYSSDNIALVLNSLTREECRRMGRNARIVYEEGFTFDGFAEQMDAVYRSY